MFAFQLFFLLFFVKAYIFAPKLLSVGRISLGSVVVVLGEVVFPFMAGD